MPGTLHPVSRSPRANFRPRIRVLRDRWPHARSRASLRPRDAGYHSTTTLRVNFVPSICAFTRYTPGATLEPDSSFVSQLRSPRPAGKNPEAIVRIRRPAMSVTIACTCAPRISEYEKCTSERTGFGCDSENQNPGASGSTPVVRDAENTTFEIADQLPAASRVRMQK